MKITNKLVFKYEHLITNVFKLGSNIIKLWGINLFLFFKSWNTNIRFINIAWEILLESLRLSLFKTPIPHVFLTRKD